jgi:enoyl-CoA hydratase/carnithine racemase
MIGGADIKEMARLDQASAEKFITGLRDLCEAARAFPAPVIARMPGWCLGGGLEFATACDFRIAAHDAKFGMPEVKVGIPSVIHAALLPRLIGWGRARWLVMTAENIDPSRMQSGSAARAESPAQAMGRTAAEGIRQSQRRRVRTILPDRRAAAADAGFYGQEAVGTRRVTNSPPLFGKRSRHAPRKRGIQ